MGWFSRFIQSPTYFGLFMSVLVCVGVIAIRATGSLQFMELTAYDTHLRWRSQALPSDPRIVLVTISEADMQKYGHPLSDEILAELLNKLVACEPRAIGLDIYRDIPVPPGSQALIDLFSGDSHRIVTITKIGGDEDPGVPPPYMVKGTESEDFVGFNDLIVDPGGIVRRGLLFLEAEGRIYYSFSLLLAMLYLDGEGIYPEADDSDNMRLGMTTFVPFRPNDGGYVGADAEGYQFLLDFLIDPKLLQSFSVSEVLGFDVFRPYDFRDKIVIIGSTVKSLKDLFLTPLSKETDHAIAGMKIHALMVSQLLRSAFEGSESPSPIKEQYEWAWIMMWSLLGYIVALRIRSLSRFVMATALNMAALTAIAYIAFKGGWWIPVVPPAMGNLFSAGLVTAYVSYQENVQKALLMQLFSRHVSKDVAEALWHQKDQFMDGGRPRPQKLIATVLFTDLKGFTSISEKLDPQALMDWLNEYMEAMAQVVIDHRGVINKYIGDAIMVIFGVPVARMNESEIGRDAINAVNCALDMGARLEQLNAAWRKQDLSIARMRVGIFTGPLVAGSLGSSERLEYTVIGDTVNVASRLESFDKNLDPDNVCRILVGEATLKYLDRHFRIKEVGAVSLKGKGEKVTIYQIMGREPMGSKSDEAASVQIEEK